MSAVTLPLVPFGGPLLTDPEADLVVQAAQGDAEAFGNLYARHLPGLYRYILARLRDKLEAEDLVEAVFLRAWEALPTYRIGEFPFSAWLHRVGHNLLVDHYRSWRTRKALADEAVEDTDLEDPGSWPEEAVLASERRRWVQGALARLRPEYQQILALRFVSGLSHAEAAEVLGVNPGTVRVLQHRALKALLAGLQGEEG
ncbi:MAG: hypothetical protein A2Y93_09040 [Chloroflexi bacterium RBG_13_68_17]|nr:MAG: hypothetical protein A2Y93_09040 [Chloroflexi bacterium RBG_13_68_17]